LAALDQVGYKIVSQVNPPSGLDPAPVLWWEGAGSVLLT
jgi:hypothetical protein